MARSELGLNGGSNCCGWDEITDLATYDGNFDAALQGLADALFPDGFYNDCKPCCGALLFTANVEDRVNYATRFAQDILKRKLGKVIAIPRFGNPNTGHRITSFAWIINKQNLLRYIHKYIVKWNEEYQEYEFRDMPRKPRPEPTPVQGTYNDITRSTNSFWNADIFAT